LIIVVLDDSDDDDDLLAVASHSRYVDPHNNRDNAKAKGTDTR
jgi:hypothetical protein